MSKQANPTLIGAFVAGALALAVALLLALGGGKLFSETRRFVVVFNGSLSGLSVGAPVTFRGVRVGQVTDITPYVIATAGAPETIQIVVTVELQKGQFRSASGGTYFSDLSDTQLSELMESKGLRAKLALQSFLTGQLYVDLDFYPRTPVNLAQIESPYPQIPTIETGIQKLGKTIEALPMDQLAGRALGVLEGIDRVVNSPEIPRMLQAAQATAVAIEQVATRLGQQSEPLVASLQAAADEARLAMAQLRQTLALDSGVPGKLAASVIATSDSARTALDQARQTLSLKEGPAAQLATSLTRAADSAQQAAVQARDAMAEVKGLFDERSQTRVRLTALLDELTGAARSLRVLADYLERHPEALLQGKR